MDTNFSIYTKLDVMPKPKKPELIYLIRGATGVLKFDLTDKQYSFNDIDQATFIFKQGSTLFDFDLYDIDVETGEKTLNNHFKHEYDPEYDYISFILTVDDTLEFKPTAMPMQYEVAVSLITDQNIQINQDTTIIEEQPKVIVKDSLYGDLLDSRKN